MTEEQLQLILQIVSQLDHNAVQGEWPHQKCRYCYGESDGYHDSQGFDHGAECIVPMIEQLRKTTWKREV